MSLRHVPAVRLLAVLAACAVLSAGREESRAAESHGPAGTAANAHSDPHGTDSAHPHAGDGHDVDYNKAPLPGSAPGLGSLFVFSLILFTGFVFAARTLVWTPLIQALDQREARVNQAHADAEAAQAEAQRLLAQHEARLAQVQEEVQGIVAQARKEAEQEKSRIIAEADAHARQLRDQALAQIEQARNAALAQIETSIEDQVAMAVEHVVGAPG